MRHSLKNMPHLKRAALLKKRGKLGKIRHPCKNAARLKKRGKILQVASCQTNRDKLPPDGPLVHLTFQFM